MPAVEDYVPPQLRWFGDPQVEVSELYVPTPDYQVLGLSQTDRIRPRDDKVIPTVEVSLRVPGLPGVFTIHIDNYAFTHADPLLYLRERAYLIRQLYALPAQLPAFTDSGGLAAG